jgi:hypothetical protein
MRCVPVGLAHVMCELFAFVLLSLAAPCLVAQLRHAVASVINLVDPASSHMLVSKIKPCMSQYKLLYGETANGSLKQL